MSGCDATQYAAITTLFPDTNISAALCSATALQNAGVDLKNATTGNTAAISIINAWQMDIAYGVDSGWLITCGAMVFIMHGGFAMLCAGAIRAKNSMNILLQTILDAAVSAIAFYVVGFGLAYGEGPNPNPFIGNALFGLAKYENSFTGSSGFYVWNSAVGASNNANDGRWTDFFFQWAFAATATTIPAGAVAERFNFNAYLGYTWFISMWVYPVVVHWVWSRQGWLTYFGLGPTGRTKWLFNCGFIDFAGSGVVHMVGGTCGLVGAILVGPRLGRFDAAGKPVEMPGHSAVLVVLGTVILWFGWYGFNPGSSLLIDNVTSGQIAARAAVTTTLSGAAGALTQLIFGFAFKKAWNVVDCCNGALVGFVTVTCCAHVIEPWAAIICGFWGCCWFELICRLLLKLKIDDPLSASPMHMGGGAAGLFFTGLLAKMDYVYQAYSRVPYWGLFYNGGGMLLGCQVVGILVIFAWCAANMTAFLLIFKLFGKLRIPVDEEQRGLDASKHGGSAYNGEEVAAQMLRMAQKSTGVKTAFPEEPEL